MGQAKKIGKEQLGSSMPTLARTLTSLDMHELINIAARSTDTDLREFVDKLVREGEAPKEICWWS